MRSFISNLLRSLYLASVFQVVLSGVIQDPKARDTKSSTLARRAVTPNASGTVGQYYYKWWSDGGADPATYINYLPGVSM